MADPKDTLKSLREVVDLLATNFTNVKKLSTQKRSIERLSQCLDNLKLWEHQILNYYKELSKADIDLTLADDLLSTGNEVIYQTRTFIFKISPELKAIHVNKREDKPALDIPKITRPSTSGQAEYDPPSNPEQNTISSEEGIQDLNIQVAGINPQTDIPSMAEGRNHETHHHTNSLDLDQRHALNVTAPQPPLVTPPQSIVNGFESNPGQPIFIQLPNGNLQPVTIMQSFTSKQASHLDTPQEKQSFNIPVSNDAGTSPANKLNYEKGQSNSNQPYDTNFALIRALEAIADKNSDQALSRARAPEVKIPNFSGDIIEYEHFKSIFNSIMERSRLGIIDRFHILTEKLTGVAKKTISSLMVVEQNYDIAWALLDDRFKNPKQFLEACIQTLCYDAKIIPRDRDSILQYLCDIQGINANLEREKITLANLVTMICVHRLPEPHKSRLIDSLQNKTSIPTFTQLTSFLSNEYNNTPKSILNEPHVVTIKGKANQNTTRVHATSLSKENKIRCLICENNTHQILECDKFKNSSDRLGLLRRYKVCFYCVKHKFSSIKPRCRSREYLICKVPGCKEHHITEMHKALTTDINKQRFTSIHLTNNPTTNSSSVIMPTAIIEIKTKEGELIPVRCLIDQCSQANYVSEYLVQKLHLPKRRIRLQTMGIDGISGHVRAQATLEINLNPSNETTVKITALIVKSITSRSAVSGTFSGTKDGRRLADPQFYKSAQIPMLLGSGILPELFEEGVEKVDGLLLQNTKLGWIISGPVTQNICPVVSTHVTLAELEKQLIDFWDMPVSREEQEQLDDEFCESLFMEKHFRDESGRYVVPIPFKKDPPTLGDSYNNAFRYFLTQEKRWERNQELKQMSDDFMKEYIDLGHMTEIALNQQGSRTGEVYYIPYMGILRQDAITTKLRNVFNASAKTTSGVSLNDQIHAGPKLQTHIFDVITRMRQFKYIYSSDITKMFRQILLNKNDCCKLRILWRPSRNAQLSEYQLNTVTYGCDCSPWQSIRTLHQCAIDNAPDEKTVHIIKKGFYVDDLLYGAHSIEECQEEIEKITRTLRAGKFMLTKWMANDPRVLEKIPPEDKIDSYIILGGDNLTVKTLGLIYIPSKDVFTFNVKEHQTTVFTKREILSTTASLYDPLGWLLPVVMKLRIIVQNLWKQNMDWDDNIDCNSKKEFMSCVSSLQLLKKVEIVRWMQFTKDSELELVGFSDASGEGYAAVIYSRIKVNNKIELQLIAAKGRVTPLKTKTNLESKLCTIPKMELEGILLLTQLYQSVKNCFSDLAVRFTAYTDSEVALAWCRNKKETINKSVKRRVIKILKVIQPENLHYVKSVDNPADPATRGLTPHQFLQCQLWFNGPPWMKNEHLPLTPFIEKTTVLFNDNQEFDNTLVQKYSSLTKLLRISAFCRRYIQNLKAAVKTSRQKGNNKWSKAAPLNITFTALSAKEIQDAKIGLIRTQQKLVFKGELKIIRSRKALPDKHWLASLDPFLDEHEILRVGGRLEAADIPLAQRHPILLTKCHLVDLIIRSTHEEHGHSGIGLTERLIRSEYWIPKLKSRIKKWIRICITCIRWQARPIQPKMSNLPAERINFSPSFSHIAVDLAGPFNVKPSLLKFDRSIKVWVAVFSCLSSKAVHLELVSDLSTDNFLAAFSRFTSRRGVPKSVQSDNGTNFIGAKHRIHDAWEKIKGECKGRQAVQQITWHLTPAYSPNFNGLCEAAVKTMKYFIRRMDTVSKITMEEFNTLLCRIEGFMNSRPLYPGPQHPSEAPALTPFELITQRQMKNISTDIMPTQAGPVTKRWLQVHDIQQQIWKRYQQEYLYWLQKRYRWKQNNRKIHVGDVVLIKDPNSKPNEWKMGKVIKCYPDVTNITRRVDIKTINHDTIHRATNSLVPLVMEEKEYLHVEEPKAVSPSIPPISETTKTSGKQTTQTLRRSNRLKQRTNALLTTLFCFMIILPNLTSGFRFYKIDSGIHIFTDRNISLLKSELKFSVTTQLNLTRDIEIIDTQIEDFRKFCSTIHLNQESSLNKHCNTIEESIRATSANVKTKLLSSYRKTKRAERMAPLVSTLIKYSPHILMAGGLIFQTVQLHQLEQDMRTARNKITKIGQIIFNLTNLEHREVELHIDDLYKQQQLLNLEQQIIDYGSNIQLLITSVLNVHQNIINIRPVSELLQFIQNYSTQGKLPSVSNPEDWFLFNKAAKTIKNDFVVVTFTIPIIHTATYTEYTIVSTPDNDGQYIILENGKNIQSIIVDNENKTQIVPIQDTNPSYQDILETWHHNPLHSCTAAILKSNISFIRTNCSTRVKKANDGVYPFGRNLVLVLNILKKKLIAECDNSTPQDVVATATIVSLTTCSIVNEKHEVLIDKQSSTNYTVSFNVSSIASFADLSPPQILIESPTTDVQIAALQKIMKDELESWNDADTWMPSSWIIMIAIVCAVCLLIICIIFIKCRHSRLLERAARNSELTAMDAKPHLWTTDYVSKRRKALGDRVSAFNEDL